MTRTAFLLAVETAGSRFEAGTAVSALLKRTFDVTLSGVGLLTSSPLWLVLVAAVKLEDGGDVFYGQERVGLGGRPFFVSKFRSMVQNAEAGVGALQASAHDPRITASAGGCGRRRSTSCRSSGASSSVT